MTLFTLMTFIAYALATLVALFILLIFLIHLGFRAPRTANESNPADYGWNFEEQQIANPHGIKLSAWWIPAQQASAKTIIILHGWGANKSLMLPIAKPFYKHDFNILLVDAHNHGDSPIQGISTMPKFADDLSAAITWVKENKKPQSQSLAVMGHSVGAAATLLTAARKANPSKYTNSKSIDYLVKHQADVYIAVSSFAHPRLVMQRQLSKLNFIPWLVNFIINYVQWVIGYKLDEIAPLNSIKVIQEHNPDLPLMLIHGTKDQVVPVEDHQTLCKHRYPKTHCLEIKDADHDSTEQIQHHFPKLLEFINKNI